MSHNRRRGNGADWRAFLKTSLGVPLSFAIFHERLHDALALECAAQAVDEFGRNRFGGSAMVYGFDLGPAHEVGILRDRGSKGTIIHGTGHDSV
jgi:hypothetical protein